MRKRKLKKRVLEAMRRLDEIALLHKDDDTGKKLFDIVDYLHSCL